MEQMNFVPSTVSNWHGSCEDHYCRFVVETARESPRPEIAMLTSALRRTAKIRYGLAALILGLPLPIVLIAFLVGGCR